jgi:hypothetical protein
MFGEGFLSFFISALHFWIKHYTNFLNLTKFKFNSTLLLLTARHNFSPQIIFLIWPVLSYLAVAMATWQH